MKIPLSWLGEYISLPDSLDVLCDAFTRAGLEVDHVASVSPAFSDVVVAKVIQTERHPHADRLQVAQVFDGERTVQVVCGDPKCRPGITIAFAKVGATLPSADGTFWTVKEAILRQISSSGMICSLEELGLASKSEGIVELPDSLIAGQDVTTLYKDTILDISLTPNLGHCMSIYGVARELSSFLQTPLRPLVSSVRETLTLPLFEAIQVQVDAPHLCSTYSCRLVTSVRVEPSPFWLARKLELAGIRSINNVVDISNYVLLLTGQPLHFFDYEEIQEKKLIVRAADTPTEMQTLDDVIRIAPSEALLICDAKRPLAIAGIMGGKEGSVQTTTTSVLIEAARFQASSIRKTSKTLSCKTDASLRFEKGTDPLTLPIALDLAADLLRQVAGGTVASGVLTLGQKSYVKEPIPCSPSKVNKLLGTHLSQGEIQDLLENLQMQVERVSQDNFQVTPPSYRNDVSQEIDLVEEVARLYGFQNLPQGLSPHIDSPCSDAPIFLAEQRVRTALLQEGLQELLTCDLTSPELSSLEERPHSVESISVLHSKSSDYSVLRSSLLPGLLQVIKYNIDRQNHDLCGFEVGKVHYQEQGNYHEPFHIGIVMTGLRSPYHFQPKTREVDFFDLKGVVENILNSFSVQNISFLPAHTHSLQPGRQAYIQKGNQRLGLLGEVHPSLRRKFDIDQRVFFAKLDLSMLITLQPTTFSVQDLPQVPCSDRDWTVTLPLHEPLAPLLATIHELASPLLEKVFLLDCFTSEKLGADRKNCTMRFIYRDKEKTLDWATVEQEHAKLLQTVKKSLGSLLFYEEEKTLP
ncbi:MAG: phenylalanine--tRNA ligase subunit beta [Chlamydiae bacterium]|nr:phenylalanine--tRNA ligase subunit beta [Chlamydiota bacterium]